MSKLNVAVLMGGMSSEHEVSLNTGENVFNYLDKNKYDVRKIIISKKGEWPLEALKEVDIVFNALHGEYGEDGRTQGLLDCFGVKYTGSGVLASALGMDKIRSRELFKIYGLTVPAYTVVDKIKWHSLALPRSGEAKLGHFVVKPSSLGSSVGISIVDNKKDLKAAVNKAQKLCDEVIIEEYLNGREMTCGVLDDFKSEKYFALPVTEIIPPKGHFFDYKVKYDGSTKEITPARIDKKLTKKIQEQAIKAHQILGCRGYSRVDFIVKNGKTPYILEVNTLPGLTKESLLPKAAKAAGIEFSELLDIIIHNA